MNHLKVSPQALDYEINYCQKKIYDKLLPTWKDLEGFGITFERTENGTRSIEAYIDGIDYEKNLISEGNKFFFVKEPTSNRFNSSYKATLDVYFILDLEECYPLIKHRAVQEAQQEALIAIEKTTLNIMSITDTNLRDLIRDLKGNSNLENFDRHPRHIFKVRVTQDYNLTKRC